MKNFWWIVNFLCGLAAIVSLLDFLIDHNPKDGIIFLWALAGSLRDYRKL